MEPQLAVAAPAAAVVTAEFLNTEPDNSIDVLTVEKKNISFVHGHVDKTWHDKMEDGQVQ